MIYFELTSELFTQCETNYHQIQSFHEKFNFLLLPFMLLNTHLYIIIANKYCNNKNSQKRHLWGQMEIGPEICSSSFETYHIYSARNKRQLNFLQRIFSSFYECLSTAWLKSSSTFSFPTQIQILIPKRHSVAEKTVNITQAKISTRLASGYRQGD